MARFCFVRPTTTQLYLINLGKYKHQHYLKLYLMNQLTGLSGLQYSRYSLLITYKRMVMLSISKQTIFS